MGKYHSELLMLFNLAFLMKCKYYLLSLKLTVNVRNYNIFQWVERFLACDIAAKILRKYNYDDRHKNCSEKFAQVSYNEKKIQKNDTKSFLINMYTLFIP